MRCGLVCYVQHQSPDPPYSSVCEGDGSVWGDDRFHGCGVLGKQDNDVDPEWVDLSEVRIFPIHDCRNRF